MFFISRFQELHAPEIQSLVLEQVQNVFLKKFAISFYLSCQICAGHGRILSAGDMGQDHLNEASASIEISMAPI